MINMDIHVQFILVFLSLLVRKSKQDCGGCDCIISDDVEVPRGVRNAKLTCNEGSVTWYNPIGALRLELSPRIAETFRLCFVLETRNAKIKVSQEKDNALNAKFPPHRSKYILNDSNMVPLLTALGTSKEYCLSSEHPVILYLEPDLSEDLGYQKITFQYDVIKQNDFSEPSIEDCRPCSKAEILQAFCFSDFVIVGSMESVRNLPDTDKTHIEVAVAQTVRQRGSYFHRNRQNSQTLKGVIVASQKCGITKGDGLFLMTGKVRFGELKLGCAPYLEEWEAIARAAELAGSMECSRD